MKLKLDENLGHSMGEPLRRTGHDVSTVREQSLCGWPDVELIAICRGEKRCLVTLDIEFGNPLLFDPSLHFGIAVLRVSGRQSRAELTAAVSTLAEGLERDSIEGRLWMVQPGRIRVHQRE